MSMHEMIIQERINAREQEFSKMAEDNRLLALRNKAPSRTTMIRQVLEVLLVRLDKKRQSWGRVQPQREIRVK